MQMNTIFSALAGAERVFQVMDEAPENCRRSGCGCFKSSQRTCGVKGCDVWLCAWSYDFEAYFPVCEAGTEDRVCRQYRRGQDDDHEPDQPVLRDRQRRNPDGWRGYPQGWTKNLRSNIAMVLQDTHLFTGTIRENIRYGRLDATDAEVEQAAKMASAHSFIMRLENGYETMIEGDGANLSQGQRQLLNIARAAISKAPVLILDEATSSVDTRTERHIEHGMDRLMAERTTPCHRPQAFHCSKRECDHGIGKRRNHRARRSRSAAGTKGRYYELYTGKKQLA